MISRFFSQNKDIALVAGVIAILLILFSPIPSPLLDFLIICNFAFALTILLLTFYVEKPVAFSTFPSILLVATLFRLALNVAATRLILTDADAGEVIGSIGTYAVQGNYAIGLVVFLILTVVQFVVVTSGAQRVSEVAARFVLDSVPGQQMSIDADLNMGLIDQNEARKRRKDLEREASFYGAMDGASKFVKGDAIAGILILLINIIAGWFIGVMQMDMGFGEALSTFTLLTIGDGIVTQVPALIIAVATGIIVTRSASDTALSGEIFRQLSSVPKILGIVFVTLLLLLMLPGMPKWPVLILAIGAIALFFRLRAKAQQQKTELLDEGAADSASSTHPAAIEILLGKELAERWKALKPVLAERVTGLRSRFEQQYGFTIPPVAFHDGASLADFGYEIRLQGTSYGRSSVFPDSILSIKGRDTDESVILSGQDAREPAFGLPAKWIGEDQREAARQAGYTLVDPMTVLITHVTEIIRVQMPTLVMRADIVTMLEGVRTRQPGLVEELVPAVLSVSDVQAIVQGLLAEHVAIRNFDKICEILVDRGRFTKDHAELVEAVRAKMGASICNDLKGREDRLSVISLDPRVEARFGDAVRNRQQEQLVLDPNFADKFLRALLPLVGNMVKAGLSPVLLCDASLRRHLQSFVKRSAPNLFILSVAEIADHIELKSFGVVSIED